MLMHLRVLRAVTASLKCWNDFNTFGTDVVSLSQVRNYHCVHHRRALVRARWEAQGGRGPTRRESTSTRQVAPTRSQTTEPSILLLLEGRNTCGPLARRDTSTFVTNGSTCRAAPRLKWDSGGSLQRPRHVEQPAPRERTQIPVADHKFFVDGRPMCTRHDHLLSELTLESNAKSKIIVSVLHLTCPLAVLCLIALSLFPFGSCCFEQMKGQTSFIRIYRTKS